METDVVANDHSSMAATAHVLYLLGILALALGIALSCYTNFELVRIVHDIRDGPFRDLIPRIQQASKTARIASLTFGALAPPYTIIAFYLLRRRISATLAVPYILLCLALVMAAFIPVLS